MRWHGLVAAVFGCILSLAASTPAAAPKDPDDEVGRSIDKAKAYLLSQQRDDGSWRYGGKEAWHRLKSDVDDGAIGCTALVLYALMEEGASLRDPAIAKGLAWLSQQETAYNYALSMRPQVYYRASRQDPKYLRLLEADAKQLWMSTHSGGFDYISEVGLNPKDPSLREAMIRHAKKVREKNPSRREIVKRNEKDSKGNNGNPAQWGYCDKSNSQYGVLGVWAYDRATNEAPRGFWRMVLEYWVSDQNTDGGWGYRKGEKSDLSMTAAGIATVYVAYDAIMAQRFVGCRPNNDFPPLRRALDWYEKNFPEIARTRKLEGGPFGHGDLFYTLYGVERVGLASGYKYFGDIDWYKLGVSRLLKTQQRDGAWKGKYSREVDTAYALLFLIRGRQPVIFNRLEYDGDWQNRPRALANLTAWLSQKYETDVNWQIITLKAPVDDWHDSSVLTISGSKAPQFSDEDLAKLRLFVQQGGTILSIQECGGRAFDTAMREVYAKLFPTYELSPCRPDHPLYTVSAPLRGKPAFWELSNGIRPLALHTQEDLTRSWQRRTHVTDKLDFQVGGNLAAYINGKRNLRHRGQSHWPEDATASGASVKVVRIKWNGNWNPEPLGWERVRRRMAKEQSVALQLLAPVAPAGLAESGAHLAVLSGTGELSLPREQWKAVQAFVEGGGTLLVDAAGGNRPFARSARQQLADTFGPEVARRLTLSSELFRRPGAEIERVAYRRGGGILFGRRESNLQGIWDKRPAVIFSAEDLTGGMVGYEFEHYRGYSRRSAYEIVRNLVLAVRDAK